MCCGKDRNQLRTAPKPVVAKLTKAALATKPQPGAAFVYTGNTGMTVTGPASGRQYRFDGPGARVNVDARDRALLASLRQLRQVQ